MNEAAWKGARVALAGSAAIVLGGFALFVRISGLFAFYQSNAPDRIRLASAGFGVILLILVLVVQHTFDSSLARAAEVSAVAAGVEYVLVVAAGYQGVSYDTGPGLTTTVHYTPGIGLLLSIAGSVAVALSMHRVAASRTHQPTDLMRGTSREKYRKPTA